MYVCIVCVWATLPELNELDWDLDLDRKAVISKRCFTIRSLKWNRIHPLNVIRNIGPTMQHASNCNWLYHHPSQLQLPACCDHMWRFRPFGQLACLLNWVSSLANQRSTCSLAMDLGLCGIFFFRGYRLWSSFEYFKHYCLSSALHSSIGQKIKSLAPISGLRCPFSGQSVKNFKWP